MIIAVREMKVIAKETLQYFVVQGAAIVLGTIFTCYGIAASLGHVPVWLPMISDCAVYAPEKYLFRLGLVTGSIFLHFESILLYNANKSFSNSRLSMIFSLMSSLGLGVVAVVNEKENNIVHTGIHPYVIHFTNTKYFHSCSSSDIWILLSIHDCNDLLFKLRTNNWISFYGN